jgi:hypothetical protein
VDPHHFDANPDSTYHRDADADPNSDFLFDADPDPTFCLMRIRIQILALKKAHFGLTSTN